MSHYGLSVRRELNTNSFHVLVLKLQTTAPRTNQQKRKILFFSAVLSFSWAMQEQGVNWEPSLCVALVCLTALTKIKFLRFTEIPKQNKMTATKSTLLSEMSHNITKQKPLLLHLLHSFSLHSILIAETLKCTYLCAHWDPMLCYLSNTAPNSLWFDFALLKACISRIF